MLRQVITRLKEDSKRMLMEDLAEIEATSLTVGQRLEAIHRVFSTFPRS